MAKLADVLMMVKDDGSKTAAAPSPVSAPTSAAPSNMPAEAALKTALHEVLKTGSEKSAAASSATPTADLERIASDVASAEHQALIKEAMMYGAAVADGAMARLAQYDEAAKKLGGQTDAPKTASAGDDTFQKFATENPALVKQTAEVGFREASHQIAQLKQAAHDRGYEAGVLAIYKTGSDTFVRGFEDFGRVLNAARATK